MNNRADCVSNTLLAQKSHTRDPKSSSYIRSNLISTQSILQADSLSNGSRSSPKQTNEALTSKIKSFLPKRKRSDEDVAALLDPFQNTNVGYKILKQSKDANYLDGKMASISSNCSISSHALNINKDQSKKAAILISMISSSRRSDVCGQENIPTPSAFNVCVNQPIMRNVVEKVPDTSKMVSLATHDAKKHIAPFISRDISNISVKPQERSIILPKSNVSAALSVNNQTITMNKDDEIAPKVNSGQTENHNQQIVKLSMTDIKQDSPVLYKKQKRNHDNVLVSDNFVRMNMRTNGLGSCKGNKVRRLKRDVERRRKETFRMSNIEQRIDQSYNRESELHVPGDIQVHRSARADDFQNDSFLTTVHCLESHIQKNFDSPPHKNKCKSIEQLMKDKNYLQDIAPLCSGHQITSKLLTVTKKDSLRKGSRFYCCSYPRDQQCNFFLWVEDNPNLIRLKLEDTSSASDRKMNPLNFALARYSERLSEMSIKQLQNEVIMYLRRRTYYEIRYPLIQFHKPSKSGKKEDIINDLLVIAEQCMDESYYSNATSNDCAIDDTVKVKLLQCTAHSNRQNYSESLPLPKTNSTEMIEFSDDEDTDSPEMKLKLTESNSETQSLLKTFQSMEAIEVLRLCFGYENFREGQDWAIQRTLKGQSSLLVSATGSGKSLCYALPAAMLPGITIVVSPLVSLMDDQAKKLPPDMPVVVCSGHISSLASVEIVQNILQKRVKVLFISPERLSSGSFHRLIGLITKKGDPYPVSLLCVDEAHCLSQWSYNFRPAFLSVRKVIDWLKPAAVLGLTATATTSVQKEIAQILNIDSEGIQCTKCVRDNLILSAVCAENDDMKYQYIQEIIKNASAKCASVKDRHQKEMKINNFCAIIYTWRRHDAESLSAFLSSQGYSVGCYHAGLSVDIRKKIQMNFDSGKVQIIVATVAFGMGIDKSDVNIVIHSYLPSSIEDYTQHIGRAGRDGNFARCYLISTIDDCYHQHALSLSNQPSLLQLLLLLSFVFVLDNSSNEGHLFKNQVAIAIDAVSSVVEVSEVSLRTYLTLLENLLNDHEERNVQCTIRIHQQVYSNRVQGTAYVEKMLKYKKSIPLSDADYEFQIQVIDGIISSCQTSNEKTFSSEKRDLEFDILLQDVAIRLKRNIEDINDVLFKLRSSKAIIYTLTEPSLIVDVFASSDPKSSFQMNDEFDTFSFLVQIGAKLLDRIKAIDNLNCKRTLDMAQLANFVETKSPIALGDRHCDHALAATDDANSEEQKQIRIAMSDYLTSVCSDNSTEFKNVLLDGKSLTSVLDQSVEHSHRLAADVVVIGHDPSIRDSVCRLQDRLIRKMKVFDTVGLNDVTCSHLAITIFKILYGIDSTGSSIQSGSIWRSSEYWGKYRHVIPDVVLAECIKNSPLNQSID